MNAGGPRQSTEKSASTEKDNFSVSAPAISLPKGGGAICGIGEKFAANPVTYRIVGIDDRMRGTVDRMRRNADRIRSEYARLTRMVDPDETAVGGTHER